VIQLDISKVKYDKCTTQEWDAVTKAIHSGKKVKIDESFYDYYLEVLPPRKMFNGGFVFQEGEGDKLKFTNEKNGFYAELVAEPPITAEILKANLKQMEWISKMDKIPAAQGMALKELRKVYKIAAVDMGYNHSGVLVIKTHKQQLFWQDKGWCCQFLGILNEDGTKQE